MICCYINMNSVRNQFKHLCGLCTGHEGTTSNAETKLDSSFPISQFLIPGFHKPFKMDIDSRKGILVYIKSSLPSNFLTNFKLRDEAQIIPFEVNLKKERWLLVSIYKPQSQNSQYFLGILSDWLDLFSSNYDNNVVLGDFN